MVCAGAGRATQTMLSAACLQALFCRATGRRRNDRVEHGFNAAGIPISDFTAPYSCLFPGMVQHRDYVRLRTDRAQLEGALFSASPAIHVTSC